jgi:hypothetical protein
MVHLVRQKKMAYMFKKKCFFFYQRQLNFRLTFNQVCGSRDCCFTGFLGGRFDEGYVDKFGKSDGQAVLGECQDFNVGSFGPVGAESLGKVLTSVAIGDNPIGRSLIAWSDNL